MEDLFAREQRIFDSAVIRLNDIENGAEYDISELVTFVKEYGRLLKHLRRVTKITDKTAGDLNTSKLNLLDKINTDTLTGIYNRRYLDENLKQIIKMLSRSKSWFSVMMIDVDFFKNYNDTYGHSAGDECLKSIAKSLTNSITRAGDFVARYGGEEFVAVLPDTDEKGARYLANKMLENIRACNIAHEKSKVAGHITISIGVTSSRVDFAQTGADYIKQADKAMYLSKTNGRDRYTFLNYGEEA